MSAAAPPARTYTYQFMDEQIINYLTANPEEDGQRYIVELFHRDCISLEALSAWVGEIRRVKRILSTYMANLVIRRPKLLIDRTWVIQILICATSYTSRMDSSCKRSAQQCL